MSTTESIIDTSRPSAGRVYDYILGGHHNFEVDRMAADQVVTTLPFLPKAMRLQRWCLQDLAVELTEKRGYNIVIDFASGLPTNDHIHHVVPPGTTVIYSDSDPVVVEYAREILADTPNVHFFQADARRPEELLNRAAIQEIIGERRDVALVYWGISVFLTDDELSRAASSLYEWSGLDSIWVYMAQGADMDASQADLQATMRIYEQMGSPLNFRSLEQTKQMIAPWHPDAEGYISLLNWHGMDKRELDPEEMHSWGPAAGGYGAYLRK
ncbi:MAG: SAM-dependent methyltransferase [Kouleothrix sp.]|nr:SAM-dependent methyltransferase [Kouleothrix sp.]